MLRAIYALLSIVVIGFYGYAGLRGMELTRAAQRRIAPQTIRGTHGGARTFWYGGYRGGK